MGSNSPPERVATLAHLQNSASFQHVKHEMPMNSPPLRNGIPHHNRLPTPQPLGMSRPSSRNAVQRADTMNTHSMPGSQPGPPQNTYAYLPNPPIFNGQSMPQPQRIQARTVPDYPHVSQAPYSQPPPAQMQGSFVQDNRRHSIPTTFPHQEQNQQIPNSMQQNLPSRPIHHPLAESSTASQAEENLQSSPITSQPRPLPPPTKSHSIFTPIDDSGSLLARRWTSNTTTDYPPPPPPSSHKHEQPITASTSAGQGRENEDRSSQSKSPAEEPGTSSRPASVRQDSQTFRKVSLPSVGSMPPTPGIGSFSSDPKRPRLKVQIPSEQSDGESAAADSAAKDAAGGPVTAATPAKASTETSHSSGVVLPPPSPSASALLSAGAQGPPNPFARPAPPLGAGSFGNNSNSNIETPISALPSRFMPEGMLSSPSSFYPAEWGFGRDSNVLPSPLTFQTPVVTNVPGFRDGANSADDKKRKADEGDDEANNKRVKD